MFHFYPSPELKFGFKVKKKKKTTHPLRPSQSPQSSLLQKKAEELPLISFIHLFTATGI